MEEVGDMLGEMIIPTAQNVDED
eukprot:SAG11_NODE_14788_length_599_cov_1.444000_1_plen_22_part_10